MRAAAILLLMLLTLAPAPTHAASGPPIPFSLFPKGAIATYDLNVSNADMDSAWRNDDAGQVLMHYWPQDEFHRLSGWMEAAEVNRGERYAFFAVFQSEYGAMPDGTRGNRSAFQDWHVVMDSHQNIPLAKSQPKAVVPAGQTGAAETRVLPARLGGPTVVMAAWAGQSREVEGMAIFSPEEMTLTAGKRMLANEIRYAIRLPDDAG